MVAGVIGKTAIVGEDSRRRNKKKNMTTKGAPAKSVDADIALSQFGRVSRKDLDVMPTGYDACQQIRRNLSNADLGAELLEPHRRERH